jgi:hypothetical protein
MAAKDEKQQAQQSQESTDSSQTIRERQDALQVGVDNVDESADTHVYPADIGFTVTSHGDGTPSISPQLIERREELREINDNPDRDNEKLAKELGL